MRPKVRYDAAIALMSGTLTSASSVVSNVVDLNAPGMVGAIVQAKITYGSSAVSNVVGIHNSNDGGTTVDAVAVPIDSVTVTKAVGTAVAASIKVSGIPAMKVSITNPTASSPITYAVTYRPRFWES